VIDLSSLEAGPRAGQPGRAEQAADMVGAEGGLVADRNGGLLRLKRTSRPTLPSLPRADRSACRLN
jgi:hypothetical protein